MHIADGVLSGPVIAVTSTLAVAGVTIGLSRVSYEEIPKVGGLSAAFFVSSLIHINIGPASAHVMLTGLLGFLLGWASFPALAAAFILQTLFFGYGGLTTLGANTLNSGIAAVICYVIFVPRMARRKVLPPFWLGFSVGATGIVLNGLFLATTLYLSDKDFFETIVAISMAHIPVVLIEAFVAGSVVSFIWKVKPELLFKQANKQAGSDSLFSRH